MINRITKLMKNNNITATKLTTGLELSNSAITEWKKGKGKPSTDAIIKIAKYFNVTTDWLLTGEGKMYKIDETEETNNDAKEISRIGIKEYLTHDENEALKCFRQLPYREQLIELGELKMKVRIAEETISNVELQNYQSETNDQSSAALEVNVS